MLSIISIKEFELRKEYFEIIDIRSVEKYNNNHIPNSINIQFEKLITDPSKYLDRYKTYCIYCTRGINSLKAAGILSKQGYRVVSLEGGYEAWLLSQ